MFRYSRKGTAKHYDEVTAPKLFRAVSSFKFHHLGLFKGHREILVDDDKLPNSYADYFISQCSNYLASRRGKATDESLGVVCVDEVHSPKRGPSCIVSTPQDVEVTKGKDASDSEQNSGNSDSYWRRKRQRDNPSKNLDHEGVTQATDRGVDMDSLPDPSGGSAQVSLNSLFDDFDLEPIKDLCFLHDDLEAISGIQELFENDNYPSKRAGEKCTPVATSPSTSEFSIQGPTAFDLATKEIDPSHSGKTNATLSSDLIHKPSRDVTRNKSIMCSSSIPAISTVTKFEPDGLILKADRQHAKMLGGDLIEKVVKTLFTLVTSFRDEVEKILQVIARIKVVDATPLRECISKYMDDLSRMI
nr:hypothetical protein CFP56_48107 [Quercus suber]